MCMYHMIMHIVYDLGYSAIGLSSMDHYYHTPHLEVMTLQHRAVGLSKMARAYTL